MRRRTGSAGGRRRRPKELSLEAGAIAAIDIDEVLDRKAVGEVGHTFEREGGCTVLDRRLLCDLGSAGRTFGSAIMWRGCHYPGPAGALAAMTPPPSGRTPISVMIAAAPRYASSTSSTICSGFGERSSSTETVPEKPVSTIA